MKEGAIDCERAIVTHHQATEVAEPGVSAFDDPTPLVTSQGATILRRRFLPVRAMRDNQFDASSCQPLTQRITVVGLVGDHPHGLLSRPTRTMTPTYADRRKRGFREPDFRRGCRVKVVSQRKTAAVDHHHPLRPLAPLGFSDSSAPFLAGAKLPSKKDSLHCNCFRSLSSARNARQTFSQMPCSSQSRSRRQQVEGCGYSSGKSCQRAPLRRIHRIPSRTRRLSIHGRPPRRFLRGFGSKGAIFFHCDSVSNGPDRAIGPPSALLTLLIAHSGKLNHHSFKHLSWVMQQLLVKLFRLVGCMGFHRLVVYKASPGHAWATGYSAGNHRSIKAMGKPRRTGVLGVSETRSPRSIKLESAVRAVRSPNPVIEPAFPRSNSPESRASRRSGKVPLARRPARTCSSV